MAIETAADLVAAVNDGSLTILDRPAFLGEAECDALHQANAGDVNAAIRLHGMVLGDAWLWQIGYDNRAVLTKRDDPEQVVVAISLSPGHALALGVVLAAFGQPAHRNACSP